MYFKYFVSTTEISLLVFTVCSFLKCLLRLKFSVIIFLILFFKHVRAPRAPEVTEKLYYTAKSRHPRPTRTRPSKTRKRRGRKAKHPLLPTAKLADEKSRRNSQNHPSTIAQGSVSSLNFENVYFSP